MATIPFPASANIVSMSLQQLYTGDVTHRSIYSGAQQTLARAPGRWTGSIELAIADNAADRRDIETWLVELRGTVNVTEIPLAGRDGTSTVTDSWALSAAAAASAEIDGRADRRGIDDDGSVWLALRDGADRPARGDYIRIASRVYLVAEPTAAIPWMLADPIGVTQAGVRCMPGVFPETAEAEPVVLRRGVTVRAQILDEPAMLPLDGEYAGPWSFSWIEVP